jgi:hypothetical protein
MVMAAIDETTNCCVFFDVDLVMLMFEDHQERFDQLDKLKIDENLRVEKLNRDEILGVRGDFKKLEVD